MSAAGPSRRAADGRVRALVLVGGLAIAVVAIGALVLNGGTPGPTPARSLGVGRTSGLPSLGRSSPSGGSPSGSSPSGSSLSGSTAPVASPPTLGPERPIAYSRTTGSPGIWTIRPDGQAATLVAGGQATGAAWSRDGSQIAFVRQAGKAPAELWVMNRDGSALRQLTTGAGVVDAPTWSPSGDRIAFAASYDVGNSEIWIIPTSGGTPLQASYVAGDVRSPSWSPDGHQVLYAAKINGTTGLWIGDPDNSAAAPVVLISLPDGITRSPTWSPDGASIAFDSSLDGKDRIWVMGADGSTPNALSPPSLSASWPTWSPDGTELVFQVTIGKGTGMDLYLMPVDGSAAPRDLTPGPIHAASDPAWW